MPFYIYNIIQVERALKELEIEAIEERYTVEGKEYVMMCVLMY